MLRYIVERISDGKFLDLELPITVSAAGRKLMGAGQFSGEVLPVSRAYAMAGTSLLVEPLGSFIHEEADGVIRGTWIVTRAEFEGYKWRIDGQGVSSYFAGRPYEGEYWGVKVDPIAAARHVITHAQSFAGANIGVTVTGSSSVRVGSDSDLKANAAKVAMDARKASWDEFAKPRKALEARVKTLSKPHDAAIAILTRDRRILADSYAAAVAAKLSEAVIAARKELVDAKDVVLKDRRAVKDAAVGSLKDQIADLKILETPLKDSYDAAKEDYDAAKDAASKDDGAWKLLWWDTPDCLASFTEAVEAAGYEWVEWSGWNADKSKILKQLRCVPRVGARRDSVRFIEGANVIETVIVEADSGDYANAVLAIGAGEGKQALRFTAAVSDGRRRKVKIVDAKQVTKKTSLETLARRELAAASQLLRVAAIRVNTSHPNAERGTFDVGDTIQIDTEAGVLDRKQFWVRISEIEWDGLDVADLMLEEA